MEYQSYPPATVHSRCAAAPASGSPGRQHGIDRADGSDPQSGQIQESGGANSGLVDQIGALLCGEADRWLRQRRTGLAGIVQYTPVVTIRPLDSATLELDDAVESTDLPDALEEVAEQLYRGEVGEAELHGLIGIAVYGPPRQDGVATWIATAAIIGGATGRVAIEDDGRRHWLIATGNGSGDRIAAALARILDLLSHRMTR